MLITLTARVTRSHGPGQHALPAEGLIEYQPAAPGIWEGALRAQDPVTSRITDGEAKTVNLAPGAWRVAVIPEFGPAWEPWLIELEEDGPTELDLADLAPVAVIDGEKWLKGERGVSVTGYRDHGDGTISWIFSDGTETDPTDISQGAQGVGIESISDPDEDSKVTVTYTDGTEQIVQAIQGAPGKEGDPGDDGHTPIIEWDGTALVIDGETGPDLKGEQGEGADVDWDTLDGKPDTFTPATHTHVVKDVDGLQDALDDATTGLATETYVDDAVTGIPEATTEAAGLMGTDDKAAVGKINRPGENSTAVARTNLDVNAWVGRVGTECTVPTHDPESDAGEAVHPSVLYFPDGWNGHRYWMGYTPYAGGNDGHEDPCIAHSDDGTVWTTPTGAPFPLDDKPGSPQYNSDTNLVVKDGVLHLFWRYFDDTVPSDQEQLYVSTSTDGSTWTPKEIVYRSTKTVRRLVSPAFHWDGTKWHLWGVDIVPAEKPLMHMTAETLDPDEWTTPTRCTLPLRSGKTPWHFSVRRVGSQYVGLMNDTLTGGAGAREGDLLIMASDDGITWKASAVPVIPRVGPKHDNLYKSDMIPTEYGFDVWYSARSTGSPSVWGIFRSRLIAYDPAVPYASEQGSFTVPRVNANGGSDERAVTFTPGLFTKAPVVFATSNNGRVIPAVSAISTEGATVKGFNWTDGNAVGPFISWAAIQQER